MLMEVLMLMNTLFFVRVTSMTFSRWPYHPTDPIVITLIVTA